MDESKDKNKDEIVSLEDYRKKKGEDRRREYERILFNRILGVYSFAEKEDIHHVEMIDVSYSGARFREENPEQALQLGDKLSLRFYFTPSSFLRLALEVKRKVPFTEEGRSGLEYGCEFDKNTKSYEVIRQLISFMYLYAETASEDPNPPMIFF